MLGEKGEMNTTIAHFAWYHSYLSTFYIVR